MKPSSLNLRRSTGRLATLAGSVSLATVLTGCGLGTPTVNQAIDGQSISGNVHGGQQPVSGATIQLYQVGTGGYGTGAAPLGTATTTDANGNFSITGRYTCPSSTTLTYLVATGGNPGLGSGTNNRIKLMAALGPCGNLNAGTFVVLNEVTTVAAASALSQYFTTTIGTGSTDGFGAPNTTQAQVGITNAFTTAATLATVSSGAATQSITTNGAGGAITITPEYLKVQTIADILAACVNSAGGTSGDGSACGTLFADSGPSGVTPVNTLEAAVLLNTNPTSNNANGSANNLAALYALIPAAAPFPAQSSAPTDWTIGVQYTGTTATMNQPLSIAIDAGGNVWVVNNGANSTGGSLNEITPAGVMTVFNPLAATVGGTAVAGSTLNPRNVAIDLTGNVWVPTSSSTGYVFQYIPASNTTGALAIGKSPYGVAVDASNNVWFSQQSSSATLQYSELLNAQLSSGSQVGYPISGSGANQSSYLAFDANGNLWASAALAASTNIFQLTNFSTASCNNTYPCTTGTLTYNSVGSLGAQPYGLAGSATAMLAADTTGNQLSSVSIGTVPAATNYGSSSSLSTPRFVAVDGKGNAWVTNRGTSGITEFSGDGTVLSPVPASGNTTPIGYQHGTAGGSTALSNSNGIGIDPSGNVWIAENTAANSTTAQPFSIYEVVGAAAPAVTPLAAALKANAYGIRP